MQLLHPLLQPVHLVLVQVVALPLQIKLLVAFSQVGDVVPAICLAIAIRDRNDPVADLVQEVPCARPKEETMATIELA